MVEAQSRNGRNAKEKFCPGRPYKKLRTKDYIQYVGILSGSEE